MLKEVVGVVVQIALVLSAMVLPAFPLAPRAAALGNPCALDPANLITNGSMAVANPNNGIAASWNKFVVAGTPTFEHVDNEQIDPNGSQYIWEDTDTFDAGIYQTITGLTPSVYYHFWLGYALAAYDPGDQQNHRNSLVGRQVGIDLTGGTNPSSSAVMWGNIYWDGIAAVNIPDLSKTFAAQSTSATVFLRAINTNTNVRSKVWFDSVCMQALDPQPPPPQPSTIFLPMILSNPSCTPFSLVATIPVGTHPKGVATDPMTNRVFVSLFDDSAIAVVDAAANQKLAAWSTNSAGHSNGIGVTGGRVFVALRDVASVAVLDATTGAFVASRAVGSLPYGVGAANGNVWIANFSSNSVTVLDAATANVIATPSGGSSPSLVSPAASSAWVSYFDGGVVEVGNDGMLLHNFTTTGAGSFGVAFNAAANRVYVSNRNNSQIAALDANTGQIAKSVTLAQVPYALTFNPSTNHLFAVLADANQLDVRDGTTLNSLAVLALGTQGAQGGDGIAVMNGRVYVSNNAAGTMSIIRDSCP